MIDNDKKQHNSNDVDSSVFDESGDDFLDSLMEDVMGDSGSNDDNELTESNEDDNESLEEADDNLGNDDNVEEEEETPVTPRRTGLLRMFTKDDKDEDDDNKHLKEDDSDKDESVSSDKDEGTSLDKDIPNIDNNVKSNKRRPLLSRVVPNEYEKNDNEKDLYNEGDSYDEDESHEEVEDKDESLVEDDDTQEDDFDLFDDMLDDLTQEENIEQAKINAELDEDVIVPLEKPGMDEVIVTPDGKSLADMLPGMRSGNKTVNEIVKKIRNQEEVVEVSGKKFSDDRYTKHVDVIEKERAEQEKRIALSMKFLQRNAKFTEQEKVIMKNLGVTNEQLAQIMKSKELTMKEKERILGLGRYGAERFFKGRRYRTTVGDTALLEFLVKFKFANTRILRWISNEPQNRTWRKLNRLRNSGLVESKSIIGIPDLWGATPAGVAIAGYSLSPGLRPMPKMITISSSMGVNYIAACLWFNTVNVLNLEDFPAKNRIISLQDDGRDRVRGEMLVSELEIRSSLGKEISPTSTTMRTLGDKKLYDVISENVRVAFEQWDMNGRVTDSPEFQLGNEYMWVLFPTSQLTLSYHVPDLVVKRERGPNGEPRSIAVEMERYDKSYDRYEKIMLAYKLDEYLYEKVVWVTPNTRVARAIEKAANEVGFDRYTIVPIITESGVYDKQDIWMI